MGYDLSIGFDTEYMEIFHLKYMKINTYTTACHSLFNSKTQFSVISLTSLSVQQQGTNNSSASTSLFVELDANIKPSISYLVFFGQEKCTHCFSRAT